MKLSASGLKFIEQQEGIRFNAYQDQRGIWTIGVGHTGPDITQGLVATQEQIDNWLLQDTQTAVNAVNRTTDVPLTQNQFDALCSLCFNIGQGNFGSSTLVKDLNAGNTAGAAAQFLVWNRVNGVPNAGLIRRRAAEQALFLQS
jgi:lysozyme